MMIFSNESRLSGRIRHSIAAAALVAGSALTAFDAQAQFTPNESLVSPNPGLVDFEFSQSRAKIAWTDNKGNMWLGGVNRDTGLFEPTSGQGQQLATGTVSGLNMFAWNGPEWISMASGDQIYFSYYLSATKPQVATNVRMALMVQDATGAWVRQNLGPNAPRMSDASSHTKSDPSAQIMYFDPSYNHYWRNATGSNQEELLSFLPAEDKAWRFASGIRAIPYVTPINGVSQVFRYLLDTKVHEQLTFDGGNKDPNRTVPWMWQAPEFGGNFVFFTFAEGSELRVYRQTTGSGGASQWTKIYGASLPAGSTAGSPEWFVYNGKSYIFMAVYVSPNDFPSEIWISNIDSAHPIFRRISSNNLFRVRNDPEVFITTRGPYIYYNRYDQTKSPDGHPLCSACSEGVYRADPGLAVQ